MQPNSTASTKLSLLKELATAKFVESVDVAVGLGIDARKSDQEHCINGAAVLPHGTGRSVRVAVFTQNCKRWKLLKLQAQNTVGMEDLADQIKKGRNEL